MEREKKNVTSNGNVRKSVLEIQVVGRRSLSIHEHDSQCKT